MRSELLGVHEDTSHHDISFLASLSHQNPKQTTYALNQTKMAVVERSHSGDKTDGREAVVLLEKLRNHLLAVFAHSLHRSQSRTMNTRQNAIHFNGHSLNSLCLVVEFHVSPFL